MHSRDELHHRRRDQTSDVLADATDAFASVAPDGIIVDWNARAEEIFGWPRRDAIGRDFIDLVVSPSFSHDRRLSVPRWLTAARGPASDRCAEFDAIDRAGRRFPVEMTYWIVPGGEHPALHVLLRDIGRRRETEESLYRTAKLVYSLDEAVLAVSIDGSILSWNRGAERTFGYQAGEIVGRDISALVRPSEAAELARWWRDLRQGTGAQRHEICAIRKNGVVITVDVTISPIDDSPGSISGASIIARDVTERRWMATTLDNTLRSLETALKETRESEVRCRRFLADAAHQLRTPIAGIRACAETLLRGAPPSERDELLFMVVRETSRASRVMSGLLAMARVDRGQPLTIKPCDIVALCEDETDRCHSLAPNLEFEVKAGAARDLSPELDADVMREVLANLLDNARRHAATRVEVLIVPEERCLHIEVLDDGPGIPDDMVDRVFERFVSLDGRGGSGLGLPIARGLAEAHGGDLHYARGFVLRVPTTGMMVDCGGAARPGPLPPGLL